MWPKPSMLAAQLNFKAMGKMLCCVKRHNMAHMHATQTTLQLSVGEAALVLSARKKEQLLERDSAAATITRGLFGVAEICLGQTTVKLLVESENGNVVSLINFAELVKL